jgi:hypothetical protein
MIDSKNVEYWTVPAAYWAAQSLHSEGFSRQEKWREAKRYAEWLPDSPPEEKSNHEWLLQALTFLVGAVETRSLCR